jgi:aminoglycoside N3'-acetyltransferase
LISIFLDKNITVVIPTYSYVNKGEFHINKSPTNLGAINKWILKNKKSFRSSHPIFSESSIGPLSEKITSSVPKRAFGNNCIFSRLEKYKSAFLYLGRPVYSGNTIVHYIEQNNNAFYRYNKIFKTKIYNNKTFVGSNYSAYVKRNRDMNAFHFNFNKSFIKLKKEKLINEIGDPNNFTNISLLDYNETLFSLDNLYKKDNNAFILK